MSGDSKAWDLTATTDPRADVPIVTDEVDRLTKTRDMLKLKLELERVAADRRVLQRKLGEEIEELEKAICLEEARS